MAIGWGRPLVRLGARQPRQVELGMMYAANTLTSWFGSRLTGRKTVECSTSRSGATADQAGTEEKRFALQASNSCRNCWLRVSSIRHTRDATISVSPLSFVIAAIVSMHAFNAALTRSSE